MGAVSRSLLGGVVALSLTLPAASARANGWVASISDVMSLVYCVVGLSACTGLQPGADLIDLTADNGEVASAAYDLGFTDGVASVDTSGCAGPTSCSPETLATADSFHQVSSDAGAIWLRIFHPVDPCGYRYGTLGPVLVFAPGGTEWMSLGGDPKLSTGDVEGLVQAGFVVILSHFPGASESIGGVLYGSDGTFDMRGPESIAALRDVTRFALGLAPTTDGALIDEIAPGADGENVGFVGYSNGGNISWEVMQQHGAAVPGLAWYVGYESPINDEYRAMGRIDTDPSPGLDANGTGFTTDDGVNPHWTGWTEADGWSFDTALLTYDGAAGAVFFDGNGNGALDEAGPSYDLDGDGLFGPTEDFPLPTPIATFSGAHKKILPRELRAAMSGLPGVFASESQCEAYWSDREMAGAIGDASALFPDLRAVLFYSKLDHDLPAFPAATGLTHHHIYTAYALMRDHGLWARLNPDDAYVTQFFNGAGKTTPATYGETDANLPKAGLMAEMHGRAAPQVGGDTWLYLGASAAELADRTMADDHSVDLADALYTGP